MMRWLTRSGLNETHPRSIGSCICLGAWEEEDAGFLQTSKILQFAFLLLRCHHIFLRLPNGKRYDKDSLSGGVPPYSYPDISNFEPTPKDLNYFTWSVLCWSVRFVTSVRRLPAPLTDSSQYNRRCRTKSILQAKEMSAVVPVVAPVSCLIAV